MIDKEALEAGAKAAGELGRQAGVKRRRREASARLERQWRAGQEAVRRERFEVGVGMVGELLERAEIQEIVGVRQPEARV